MSGFWQPTPDSLALSSNHIDVWLCSLKNQLRELDKFYSLLADNERERADRLRMEDKRQQYIITRGLLRKRLGVLTNLDPTEFVFDYLQHGKPVLADDPRYADISFNVSHSNDLALIAITREHKVGIDIEKINNDVDHNQLVKRFFSRVEQSEFASLPETIKARAFCACWTRKEAFIKAIGDGITYGLDNFDVPVDPEIQAPNIYLHQGSDETWSAVNLPINPGYMACLASNGLHVSVRYWE